MSMDFVKNVILYAFFGVFSLLVGLCDRRQTTSNTLTISL